MAAGWDMCASTLLEVLEGWSQEYLGWNEGEYLLITVVLLAHCLCSGCSNRRNSPNCPYLCHLPHLLEGWGKYAPDQDLVVLLQDEELSNVVVETCEGCLHCSSSDGDEEMRFGNREHLSCLAVAA